MSNEHSLRLPKDWYEFVVVDGVDEAHPSIYEWNIDGGGTYIGKYTHISRPVKEYGRNIYNLLNGRAYRRQNLMGFGAFIANWHKHIVKEDESGSPFLRMLTCHASTNGSAT